MDCFVTIKKPLRNKRDNIRLLEELVSKKKCGLYITCFFSNTVSKLRTENNLVTKQLLSVDFHEVNVMTGKTDDKKAPSTNQLITLGNPIQTFVLPILRFIEIYQFLSFLPNRKKEGKIPYLSGQNNVGRIENFRCLLSKTETLVLRGFHCSF